MKVQPITEEMQKDDTLRLSDLIRIVSENQVILDEKLDKVLEKLQGER